MIILTRLNGSRFAINDEQIERLEEAHDTIVVLVTGNRYAVSEGIEEIVEAIVNFRARVLGAAEGLGLDGLSPEDRRHTALSLLHSRPVPSDTDGLVEMPAKDAEITPLKPHEDENKED